MAQTLATGSRGGAFSREASLKREHWRGSNGAQGHGFSSKHDNFEFLVRFLRGDIPEVSRYRC